MYRYLTNKWIRASLTLRCDLTIDISLFRIVSFRIVFVLHMAGWVSRKSRWRHWIDGNEIRSRPSWRFSMSFFFKIVLRHSLEFINSGNGYYPSHLGNDYPPDPTCNKSPPEPSPRQITPARCLRLKNIPEDTRIFEYPQTSSVCSNFNFTVCRLLSIDLLHLEYLS
jgi:hypothetical protein